MTPKRFMLIAGEASGDVLAAELVSELRAAFLRRRTYSTDVQPVQSDLAPRFFGAGGSRMAAAGVELSLDLIQHAMVGLPRPKEYFKFTRFFDELFALAIERQPHVIILVDFNKFNLDFAARVRKYVRAREHTFNNWNPKIVKYVSPQVWASRENRAYQIARDFDLLLSIFPFEKAWYAATVPRLPVEFIGHPIMDRYQGVELPAKAPDATPLLLLLPGSRPLELKRHLPPMLAALKIIQAAQPDLRARMIVPSRALLEYAAKFSPPADLELRCGGLPESLAQADLAIAKTGTITMECAYFGVPTVTLYVTSTVEFQIGKRLVKVKYLTMPNLLAGDTVFPEFLQNDVTPENLARAALELLRDGPRREKVRAQLGEIIASLGGPGARRRAAEAIMKLVP